MFEGLDKIIVESSDLEMINDFNAKNKDSQLGEDWFLPMMKGVIVIDFKEYEAKVAYQFSFKDENLTVSVFALQNTKEGFVESFKILFSVTDGELKSEYINGEYHNRPSETPNVIMTTIMNVMYYMSNVNKHKIYEVNEKSVKKKNNSNKKGKNNNRVAYVKSKKYYISEAYATKSNKKESITRVFSWSVRGHWRTYKKSGNTIWIEGYEKGNKDGNKKDKNYKIK